MKLLRSILLMILTLSVLAVVTPYAYAETAPGGEWTFSDSMPSPRGMHNVVVLNGKVYLFGNFDQVDSPMDIFDPVSNTWSSGKTIPFKADWYGAGCINGKIYAIVSESPDKVLRAVVYDPSKDVWTMLGKSPHNRFDPAVIECGGKLYVFGGFVEMANHTFGNTRFTEEYDPATDRWELKADMPSVRHASGTALVNGIIYVLGGVNNTFSRPPSKVVEKYDPVKNTWFKAASMPIGLAYHSVAILGNKLYAIGGGMDDSAVLEYDYINDTWAKHEPSPIKYNQHRAITLDDRILIFGGISSGSNKTVYRRTVAVFKPR